MKLLYLVGVLLGLLPWVQAQSCTSDQINAVNSCYRQYLKYWGFDTIPAYNLYQAALDNYAIHGWNGELYICNAGKTLFDCMGANDGCVTMDVFQNISGLTSDDVLLYIIDYRDMQYRCVGDGFTEYKDIYTCLQRLEDCPGDPSNCKTAADYILCIEDSAYKLCGAEARDYVCNIMDINAKLALNCVDVPKCSKGRSLKDVIRGYRSAKH